MANLQESYQWENAIHELDEGFMQGGPEGVDNIPPRQLAGRTQFLAALGLILGDATGMGLKELYKTIRQRMQEGVATIYNRGVVNGCTASKAETGRKLLLAPGGVFLGGRSVSCFGNLTGISVPSNYGSTSLIFNGYLSAGTNGALSFMLTDAGEVVPPGGVSVCRVTVPAGNTATDLAGVTVTDTRRLESGYPVLINSLPYASIALQNNMLDTNYAVLIEVVSSSGMNQQSEVYAADKATNGFKLYVNGTVDAVNVRWLAVKLGL